MLATASRFQDFVATLGNLGGNLVGNLGQKMGLRQPPRLTRFAQLADFVAEHGAFVSQTALYTYVKARAGTSFPKLFEHEAFVTSLHIARWHIFAAAVVDLALFAARKVQAAAGNDSPAIQVTMARRLGQAAFASIKQQDVAPKVFSDALHGVARRAKLVLHMATAADSHPTKTSPFSATADAFLRWAPMAEAFKKEDEEIMRNSMEMRWIEVRRVLDGRLDAAAVYADWLQLSAAGDDKGDQHGDA